jgi:very-short-patch-repair endonuclease
MDSRKESGLAYVAILILLAVMSALGFAFIFKVGTQTTATMTRGNSMQAHYLAESAANHAMWRLLNEPGFPASETTYYMHPLAGGRYGFPYTVLLVVNDAANLSTEDAAKKAVIESWGYTVVPISDEESQSNIDDALASTDVVYIAESTASGTASTKFTAATIGVLNEEGFLNDELGMSSTNITFYANDLNITDNSHYITNLFGMGPLPIVNSSQGMSVLAGSMAAGLQNLAISGSNSALDILESGAILWGGGKAAGRRVKLPWANGANFDVNEWGAGASLPYTVLLVVNDAANLSTEDAAKKAVIESWGYTVVPISDEESQSNIDDALASTDVVYITESTASGTASTKFTAATIGVLNEEGGLNDELGMSSTNSAFWATDLNITNNSHYITKPFGMGPLPIVNSSQRMSVLAGTMAAGLQNLARSGSNSALDILESGALLWGGGTAAGRRVKLPWAAGANFDVNALNADGRTLLRRAIEWGAGAINWHDPAWLYRQKITIFPAVTDTDLTNFPYLVNVADPTNELFINAQTEGKDILFTDSSGVTKLDHEIEKYDSAGNELFAWVKIPLLSSTDPTVIYMYYYNAFSPNQENPVGVWSNGYEAVYHLHDDFKDALNNHNGINTGSTDVLGPVADAQDFYPADGVDNIHLGNWKVTGNQLTIQAWLKSDDNFVQNDPRVISKANAADEQSHVWMMSLYNGTLNENRLRFRLKTGIQDTSGTTTLFGSSPNGYLPDANEWYLVAMTYDGAQMQIIRDGLDAGSVAKAGDLRENSWIINIGNNPGSTNQDVYSWDGKIDEVRISSIARPLEWMKAEYRNQGSPGTYQTLEDQETY